MRATPAPDFDSPDGADDGPRPAAPRAGRRAAIGWRLVPLALSVLLVLLSAGRLDRPFGPTYEGFNTAVWATGAQTVRTHGWVESRLGARAVRGDEVQPYAHHPALTQVVAAAAGTVLGDHRWAYRLAALAFSVAAVWTCWGWLGACRFRDGPRALGVLAAVGTPLVRGYGVMLNMEIVWLPLLFGLLWAWQAAERAPSRRSATVCGAVALAGGLAAHQGILLAGTLGMLGVARAVTARRRPQPHELSTLAGAVVGGLAFLGWVAWVNGGLGVLWRQAGVRVGARSWADWVLVQAEHLVVLFGVVGTAALLGAAVLVRRRPELWAAAGATFAVTAAYATVFRDGAWHPYWNAGLVVLVAVGAALVADVTRRSPLPLVPLLALLGAVPFLAGLPGTQRSDDHVAAVVAAGRDQPVVYGTVLLGDWAIYESGRPVETLADCDALRRVARTEPEVLVVASEASLGQVIGRPAPSLEHVANATYGELALVPADELAGTAC